MPEDSRHRTPRSLLDRMLLRRAAAKSSGQSSAYVRLLYTRPEASPERKLVLRLLLVAALLGFTMLVFWLERENLRDAADGHVSFADIVYFTFVTVTTVGYGDIVPVGERARLLDALLVTPIRIFVWFVFLGTAYEFVVQRIIEDFRMNALRQALQDHIVICGFGYSGRVAAREMTAQGHAADRIVVIDLLPERLEDAAAQGYIGLRGDATRDVVLREALIAKAKAVLVCVARDDTTVLAVLSARSVNTRARIIASVRDEENLALIRKAGADEVVSPSKIAGFLIADAVSSKYTTRFVSDILTTRGGELRIVERAALPAEVGKCMREVEGRLVVAIERNGTMRGFWNAPAERIQEGDLVFAIESRDRAQAA
ncbi:MAG: potassium channel family protein [Betaproteobacteria bacterium]